MASTTIRKGQTFQTTLGRVVIERATSKHVWFTCTVDDTMYERDTARWLFEAMYLA
jgi:hypothetical protein